MLRFTPMLIVESQSAPWNCWARSKTNLKLIAPISIAIKQKLERLLRAIFFFLWRKEREFWKHRWKSWYSEHSIKKCLEYLPALKKYFDCIGDFCLVSDFHPKILWFLHFIVIFASFKKWTIDKSILDFFINYFFH